MDVGYTSNLCLIIYVFSRLNYKTTFDAVLKYQHYQYKVHFVNTSNSYTINDIHWLPAEHMLHLGLVKRAIKDIEVLSKYDIKHEIDDQTSLVFKLMDNIGMITNAIVPDFIFIDKRKTQTIALCVFLLPDERWGVEHQEITAKLKIIDKYDVNFLLVKQRANYSEGRMDAIIRDLKDILGIKEEKRTTEQEGG